ncbi:MAG: RagB/SusD family nutrient uptake outer membrane protein [Bacteroidales bacterium]|nr:RagB/SusD family nutrient uptake outer membrane protein [Bacteroidales bacterium]MBS3775948.1 RagB/SusD family nutrient uptake outer membrane protein [Bacteroidales bacterium]
MRHKLMIMILGGIFLLGSCTELEQEPASELTNDQFFQNERQVLAAIGPAYSSLNYPGADWDILRQSDICMIPTRGRHWYDGGTHLRSHWHDWNLSEANGPWTYAYGGISTCNRIQFQIDQLEDPSQTVLDLLKELRALRAYYYFWALEFYGNVPIVKKHDVPEGYAPDNQSREEVYNFVVSELEEAVPDLPEEVSTQTYGRMTKWAGYTLLAKLYLNSKVYTGDPIQLDGEAQWQKAIDACDQVIESGEFALEDNYFANFATDNENSSENIWVIPTDPKRTGWKYMIAYATLHYENNKSFPGFEGGPWNGFCAVPSFYDSYEENDVRQDMWIEGLQTSVAGDTLYGVERVDGPLVFVNEVGNLENAYENEGVRIGKFDYTNYRDACVQGDLPIFRYADVLLMKAEALMRQNGGEPTGEALSLVNRVRNRAGVDPLSMNELTLDTLLAERGHELATEGWRRNDLIRFGEFIKPFYEDSDVKNIQKKVVNEEYVRLFPIPEQQINANPNLEQNPGY